MLPRSAPSAITRWFITLTSLLLAALPAHAEGTTQVRVTPAETQVTVGQTTQMAVEVADVQGLYGFDITLQFDPNAVQVIDSTLGSFMDSGFVVVNQVDDAAGTLHFAMTQVSPSEPKNGSGILIVFHLTGKGAGTASALNITKADLATSDAALIPATLVPAQVNVVTTSPSSTQTPTPLPASATRTPNAAPNTPAPGATVILTSLPAPATQAEDVTARTPAQTPAQAAAATTPPPTTQPPTLAAGATNAPTALPPTAISRTSAPNAHTQPVTGATAVPTIASPTPAGSVTAQAASATTSASTVVNPAIAPSATSLAIVGSDITVTAQVASNLLSQGSITKRAVSTGTSRGLDNPTFQTVLVLGCFGIGLILFIATTTGLFIYLQPLPGELITRQSSGHTPSH